MRQPRQADPDRTPGAAAFRAYLASTTREDLDVLERLCRWAEDLEQEGLTRLFTRLDKRHSARDGRRWPILNLELVDEPRVMWAIWATHPISMNAHLSVLQRCASASIEALGRFFEGGVTSDKSIYEFPQAFLREVRESFVEASRGALDSKTSRSGLTRRGTASSDHPDLVAEQAYIDYAHECLERMVAKAGRLPEAAATPKVAPALRELSARMVERLSDSQAVVFGRIDPESEAPLYIGRHGIRDEDSSVVVVNWQAPAATPYYTATPGDPKGLLTRRYFDMDGRRLRRILEERFVEVPVGVAETTPRSPIEDMLLAELDRDRTDRMRDIVTTIQRDQYRLMSAPLDGVLAIQGAPGTGKTVIGLHRASWLLFNHRERLERAGILVVGPNRVFMRYIADVLPSLGEEAVDQSDVHHLVARVRARGEDPPRVARLKGAIRMAGVIEADIWRRIRVPTEPVRVGPPASGGLRAEAIREAVERARGTGAPYMEARRTFVDRIRSLIFDGTASSPGSSRSFEDFSRELNRGSGFRSLVDRIWPSLSATQVIRELLGSRDRLASASAGILEEDERVALYRQNPDREKDIEWTDHDLPLIDEAEAILNGIEDQYGHLIVDEAQDLTPMQLRMVGRRAARSSVTLLGDIAQATGPWVHRSWNEITTHLGKGSAHVEELVHVYRVPREVMELALPVLAEIAPESATPKPFRESRPPSVTSVSRPFLGEEAALAAGICAEEGGTVAVIAPETHFPELRMALDQTSIPFGDATHGELGAGVQLLTPRLAKGLEFDHVVVVEPIALLREAQPEAAYRELYVALTRPTRSLTIFHAEPLPRVLGGDADFPAGTPDAPSSDDPASAEAPAARGEVDDEQPRISARLSDALAYARLVGARDPGTARLVERGFAVAGLLIEAGAAEEEAIAALLRPVAENLGDDGAAEVRRLFGPAVAEALSRSIYQPEDSPITPAAALQEALVSALSGHDPETVIEALLAIEQSDGP